MNWIVTINWNLITFYITYGRGLTKFQLTAGDVQTLGVLKPETAASATSWGVKSTLSCKLFCVEKLWAIEDLAVENPQGSKLKVQQQYHRTFLNRNFTAPVAVMILDLQWKMAQEAEDYLLTTCNKVYLRKTDYSILTTHHPEQRRNSTILYYKVYGLLRFV